MSLVTTGLTTVGFGAVTALAAGVVAPRPSRGLHVGALTSLTGAGGVLAGIGALAGQNYEVTVAGAWGLGAAVLSVDALSGAFLLLIGGVAVASGAYHVGATGSDARRTRQVTLPLFVAAMLLVPVAGNVLTLLVLWEAMALTALVLLLADSRRRPPLEGAAGWYAAISQGGWAALVAALVALDGGVGGGSFEALRAGASELAPATRSLVFVLIFVGFGSTAGMVPLHAWLPRVNSQAPSQVCALMSAAMVSLGLYGLIRVGFDLLGGAPRWWGALLLAAGALSALYGVLQASIATDLTRLLGYATTQHSGLMLVGVGAAGLCAAEGNRPLASVLMAAAIVHAVNHAGFQTVLVLGVGSVLRCTGLRNPDQMGGLAARMPVTTTLTAVGALGAAALPPGNGFVSGWMLLQGLVHSMSPAGVLVTVTMPLAVGVVAFTAGLTVVTLTRAFGVAFLARPRSAEAAAATESPRSMRVGMGLAALGCAALALFPTAAAAPLARVVARLPSVREIAPVDGGALTLRLAGIAGSMSPVFMAAGLLAGGVLISILARRYGPGLPRRTAPVWEGGASRLTPPAKITAPTVAQAPEPVVAEVLLPERDAHVGSAGRG